MNRSSADQVAYDNFVYELGCSGLDRSESGVLDCLRKLDLDTLNTVLDNPRYSGAWDPHIDGDLVARHSSLQLADGDFVRVPIISGAVHDEGATFGQKGIDSVEAWAAQLATTAGPERIFPPSAIDKIAQLYVPGMADPALEWQGPDYVPPTENGAYYRQVASYAGE